MGVKSTYNPALQSKRTGNVSEEPVKILFSYGYENLSSEAFEALSAQVSITYSFRKVLLSTVTWSSEEIINGWSGIMG